MEILRYFICFILISTAKASARPKYYFLKDGVLEMKVDDLQSETETRIDRMVVDFGSSYYLHAVFSNEKEAKYPRKMTSFYINSTNVISHICEDYKKLPNIYFCLKVSRLLLLEGEDLNYKYDFEGHYTYVENYIGCYFTKLRATSMNNRDIEMCKSICHSESFYGLNGANCLCVNDTSKLSPVDLELCNFECQRKSQYCGGDFYFSLYSRERGVRSKDPSWECIYENKSCPVCPEGRKGISCEVIDCLNNNGNCGEANCQSMSKWDYMTVAVCICKKGYYVDRTSKCKDVDECLDVTCDIDRHCFNSVGSFSCDCQEGFDDINDTCVDIEECLNNIVVCTNNSHCVNTIGGYYCKCNSGYYKTLKKQCAEIVKKSTSRKLEDNYSTEVYDEYDTFQKYYNYAFGLLVFLVVGSVFISLLCQIKNSPLSRESSLASSSSR